MNIHLFGTLPNGEEVQEIHLKNGDMTARVITWGAVVRDLRLPVSGRLRPVVLGFPRLSDYLRYSRNHGANVGRYGGRIREGRLVIDGRSYALARNLDGRHHSHGGKVGLGRRNWRLVDATSTSVTLTIHSPDGDEGYPGALDACCRYELGSQSLIVTITAHVSEPSPVNFLHHSYFNLDGAGRIHSHRLQMLADQMLEADTEGLPTGRIVPVAGGRFDFRLPQRINDPGLYDASYVLDGGLQINPRAAARLWSGDGALQMDIRTTEPGLHFYSGYAAIAPVQYLDGRPCESETGLCLEATRFNDAVNQPHFGQILATPEKPYRQQTEFHFLATV
ncbi:MAG: galactose mutarotase [Gammaproteobacteria bacterium]|nr:galactose mutarotase [Gammaproteobacteria bacterium]